MHSSGSRREGGCKVLEVGIGSTGQPLAGSCPQHPQQPLVVVLVTVVVEHHTIGILMAVEVEVEGGTGIDRYYNSSKGLVPECHHHIPPVTRHSRY